METQPQIGFEEIEHTADNALLVRGRSWEQLLINAALGMNSLMVPDISNIGSQIRKQAVVDAIDAEGLLVEWLSELAYWAEKELLVFTRFEFQQTSSTIVQAIMIGGHARQLQKHIKAVTYHNLEIVKTDKGLAATVVFDV
jgi:SHS2 domain-containing protein